MNIKDKVFVKNWVNIYTNFTKWDYAVNNRVFVFPWTTKLPSFIKQSNDIVVTTPKLTQKGIPFKNGDTVEVSRTQSHKEYEYTILEIINHPNNGKLICLISSNHTDKDWNKVYAQVSTENLTSITDNLGKWKIGDDFKNNFPKELFDVYYDTQQNVLFGSTMSKGIVTYYIVPKEYTVDNIAIYYGSSILYNHEECNLKDKKTTNWEILKAMCTNQKFCV